MVDCLAQVGVELSEAMVYGLGSGAAFTYLKQDQFSPHRIIAGRPERLETQVADSLGLSMREHRTDDADEGWRHVTEAIGEDLPIIVQCDLAELPYWEASTPFNGHRVVVVAYEEDGEGVWVADTGFDGLQKIDRETLHAARASDAPPSGGNEFASWVLEPTEPRPMNEAIVAAIRRNWQQMEGEETTGQTLESWHGEAVGGLAGLRMFAEEVPDWEELADAVWCYRFAYECIEKRGTGGAMFRRLYKTFLSESADHVTEFSTQPLAHSMSRVSEAWSTLATYLDAMATHLETDGEEPGEDPRHHVETMAEAVFQFESTFWDRVGVEFQ
jgi:hypothetical protein